MQINILIIVLLVSTNVFLIRLAGAQSIETYKNIVPNDKILVNQGKIYSKIYRSTLAKLELREKKPSLANYTYEFEMNDLISFRTKEFLTHYAGELASDKRLRLEEAIKLFGLRKRELIEEAKAVINQLFGIVDRDDIKKRYQKLISDKLKPEINRKKDKAFKKIVEKLFIEFNPKSQATYARASDFSKDMFELVDWENIKMRIFEKKGDGGSILDLMVTEYHKEVTLAWKGQAELSVGAYQKNLHDKSRTNKPKKYIHIVDNSGIKKVIRENITNQVYLVITQEKEKWREELEKKVKKARDQAIIKRKGIQAAISSANKINKPEASKDAKQSTNKKNKTEGEGSDGKKGGANNLGNGGKQGVGIGHNISRTNSKIFSGNRVECLKMGVISEKNMCVRYEEILHDLREAPLAYNKPNILIRGDPVEISLVLDSSSLEDPAQALIHSTGKTVEGVTKISQYMSAELSGVSFRIESVNPSRQLVTSFSPTRWTWKVVALDAGINKLLTLDVFAHIQFRNGNISDSITVRTFRNQITVNVKMWDRVADAVNKIHPVYAFIVALLGGVGAIFLWWNQNRQYSATKI